MTAADEARRSRSRHFRTYDPMAAPRIARLLAGFLLSAFVAQAAIAAMRDSVTIDEFVGLPVGLYTLQTVDFRSESMNPPFFRSFAALPLLSAGTLAPRIPPMNEVNDWAMGYRFMEDYRQGYHELFIPARCMVILTATILAALVLQWATELYGWEAGLAALALYAFSPTILAQAHLVTLDISGALGWTAAAYLTWRLLDDPGVWRATLLGLILGLAPVMKLSGITTPIVCTLLVGIAAARERRSTRSHWLALLALALIVALFELNTLYRFEGVGIAFRDIDFASARMTSVAASLPWLRLPIPKPFLKSLDVLFVGDQPTEPAYFFAGEWSLGGWWYYHVGAFLLKTSLPFLIVAGVAVGAWLARRSSGLRDYCVFVPALSIFAVNSVLNPLNIGVRHALPAYPLLAIGAAPWIAAPIARFGAEHRDLRTWISTLVAVLLVAWHVCGSLRIAPRYLEFFNEVAGGPSQGHHWLIDSNIDWGQDLIRLREYMTKRHLSSVHLAYFGRVDPSVYGIGYTPIVENESHGTAVVSASFLMGRPYWVWRAPNQLAWSHHGAYRWLQHYDPIARVGSMFVFELP
jgi:hypothetical protein